MTSNKGTFVQVPDEWFLLCRKYEEYNITINYAEIILLAIIDSFEDCHASKAYFASRMNCSEKAIEKYLRELKKVGFIETTAITQYGKTIHTTRKVNHEKISEALNF